MRFKVPSPAIFKRSGGAESEFFQSAKGVEASSGLAVRFGGIPDDAAGQTGNAPAFGPSGCSAKPDLEKADYRHLEQHESMSKAADAGSPISSGPIPDGNIDDSQAEDRSRKEELEIPKWIKIAEIRSPPNDPLIVMSRNQFGSTEGIGKRRIENEAQRLGEEDISETIQEAHRFALHWVDQTGPVNEVGEALAIRFVE